PGERGSDRTRDVRASLRPIEAKPAKVTAVRAQRGELDPEPGEKSGAGRRDLGRFVVEHDIFASDEHVDEGDAEPACQMTVADARRTERARLTRERAVARSLLERHGDD